VIHISVLEFFNSNMEYLGKKGGIGEGHVDIMHTCLRLIEVQDLDELVEARLKQKHPDSNFSESGSVGSFSSAGTSTKRQYLSGDLHEEQPESQLSLFIKAKDELSTSDGEQFRLQLLLGEDAMSELTTSKWANPSIDMQPDGNDASRVLLVWPEILNYAISELASHAKEAQKHKGDATSVIKRLSDENEKRWTRFKCLSEFKPRGADLKYWAYAQVLDSWVEYLDDNSRPSLVTDSGSTWLAQLNRTTHYLLRPFRNISPPREMSLVPLPAPSPPPPPSSSSSSFLSSP
jgi:hypothetical protein